MPLRVSSLGSKTPRIILGIKLLEEFIQLYPVLDIISDSSINLSKSEGGEIITDFLCTQSIIPVGSNGFERHAASTHLVMCITLFNIRLIHDLSPLIC
jgi:hypothetical protein